jgi:hypothetical protein
MYNSLSNSILKVPSDSPEFIDKVRMLAVGVACDHKPLHLYVIRVDNWFGPRWLYFSGKMLGALGVWKDKVTVPPFVPHRVMTEELFEAPNYEKVPNKNAIHINCTSEYALLRRIAEIDKNAAFLWFSGDSQSQKRGSVMVYLPISSDDSGFYVSFAEKKTVFDIAMLRGISRAEIAHLEERGHAPAELANA